jgi:RNA polymerase sigma-70 factor (ECF subfamily)
MDSSTRYSLVDRVCKNGDAASWGEFFALYRPLLYSYVKKKVASDHDVEEIVQCVFIALWKALPRFQMDRQKGRFRTWLWRVASNAVVDHLRRRGREPRGGDVEGCGVEPATFDPDPEAGLEEAFRKRALAFAMQKVREETEPATWKCFEQHKIHLRSAKAVAAELGLTDGAVNTNASRVLKKIRLKCAEYREEEAIHDADDLPL